MVYMCGLEVYIYIYIYIVCAMCVWGEVNIYNVWYMCVVEVNIYNV